MDTEILPFGHLGAENIEFELVCQISKNLKNGNFAVILIGDAAVFKLKQYPQLSPVQSKILIKYLCHAANLLDLQENCLLCYISITILTFSKELAMSPFSSQVLIHCNCL